MDAKILSKQAFYAVGMKWEGTFQEAAEGEIRKLMELFKGRIQEIPNVKQSDMILGFTEDLTPHGFTYYVTVETMDGENMIPENMTQLSIPTLTYAVCEHKRGMNVEQTYEDLAKWYTSQGFELEPGERTFETYSLQYQPLADEPEFCIYSPIRPR